VPDPDAEGSKPNATTVSDRVWVPCYLIVGLDAALGADLTSATKSPNPRSLSTEQKIDPSQVQRLFGRESLDSYPEGMSLPSL